MPPSTQRASTASLGSRAGLAMRRLVRRSPALTNFAVRTLGRLQGLRDRRLSSSDRWTNRASSETRYWADSLRAEDAQARFADRLDPEAQIEDPPLEKAVDEIGAEEVRVLDVGSGPLTSVGKRRGEKRIEVVPIDPLADDYVEILRESPLEAPVLPIACGGEKIVERFGTESFDVAFSLNALDHSADPLLVLDNMLSALKPGGRVALTHMRNEGERNGYFGIHFWNIECRDGRFTIWNRTSEHDVNARLSDRYEVECWDTDQGERVHCVIRPQQP